MSQVPMANLASSSMDSPSTSTSGAQYDVFINHRGPDVKNTFASHLYRGLIGQQLRVFLDREEMEKGHNISSQIEDAISVASVHIAILSPTYAASSWCLNELVLMKESRGTILPVFFKVNPSDVRHNVKKGVYAEALQGHEQKTADDSEIGEKKPRYSSDTIQKSRKALSDVADLSGFVHGNDDDEGELLHNLIQKVLKIVPKTPLDVAKYPTGLDDKLKEFEKVVLSQQDGTERREAKVVGIVGVGGVGKTTLAKQFFNLRRSGYNSYSFLYDVRENAGRLPYLQMKLLRDLKPTEKNTKIESRDEGVEILKEHLSICRALIVLDDVDHPDQLEAFLPIKKILGPHSLILITSRDKHVLTTSEVLDSCIYTLKGMNILHSKELFCCYAFHQSDPLPEFADLVDRFVEACSGLPLSLKVFGAQVFGHNERPLWQDILDNIHNILPTDIKERLRISYDSLEPNVRVIFLDIACFFLGEHRDKAKRIWGEFGVQNLQDRSLLEVDSEYKIKMHDHIRDMGREIAKDGSLPLRLWHHDLFQPSSPVIIGVHGIKTLSSSIDFFRDREMYRNPYLWPSRSPPKRLENFYGMEKLQLLATQYDHLEDILRRVQPPHLKWFRWCGCSHSSLPDWIPMENLRVFEIHGRSLKRLWQHQSRAVPIRLRELNIVAPLSDIPKSIGQLKYLEKIVICAGFGQAITIERLPIEFCQLDSLEYLVFRDFSRIESLPESFGNLKNLQHINLKRASSLRILPYSFGNLTRLKHLSLCGCKNLTLSNITLGNITTLEYLDLSHCERLKELPPQVAHQPSLQKLYLRGMTLKKLPSGIGNLCNLEDLKLGSYLLEALPLGLVHLKNLQFLLLVDSPQLKCLPNSIGLLTQLTSLNIRNCGIEYLPQELLNMSNLEVLTVSYCPLLELPFKREVERARETLFSVEGEKCMFGLKEFSLLHTETRVVFFDEGVCPNLQHVSFLECHKLRQIGGRCGLPKPRHPQISHSKFEELHAPRELDISLCREIQELPGLEHLTSLERLHVLNCEELQSIQGLGQLTMLQQLSIYNCPEIQALPGVEHLISLEELCVVNCDKLQSISGQLTKLRKLIVTGWKEIGEALAVEHLTSLEELIVSDCYKLQSISGQLTKLRNLIVDRWKEIGEPLAVEHLTSLEKLVVVNCEKLHRIQGLGQLTKLRKLIVIGSYEIQELPGVEHLTSLEKLVVVNCEKLHSIQGLGQLTKLQTLHVSVCNEIQQLPGVENLTSLQKLKVDKLGKLKSIQGLGQFSEIRELAVRGCQEITELPGLERLIYLETLDVCGLRKLKNIQGLGQLTQLRRLDVNGCYELEELPGVEGLKSLQTLDARECRKLQWKEGVLEQLRRQLGNGFKYEENEGYEHEEQRNRCGCLQLLQSLFRLQ